MERVNAPQEKRPKQGSKANKKQEKPMRVVYITDPMKFKASTASEFRALVQELTGKDSDVADNLAKYSTTTDPAAALTASDNHVSNIDNSDSGQACSASAEANGGPMELFDAAFQTFPWFVSSFNDVQDSAFGDRD